MDSYLPRPVEDDDTYQDLDTPDEQVPPISIAGSLAEEIPPALLKGKFRFHAVAPNTLRVDVFLNNRNGINRNRRV